MFFDVRLRSLVAPAAASLALFLLAPGGASSQQVEVKVDGGSPQLLSLDAADDVQVDGTFTGTSLTIPNDKPTTLTPQDAETKLAAKVWDFDVAKQLVGKQCASLPTEVDGTLTLDMAKIDCPGILRNGALIEVRAGDRAVYFVMNNRVAPQVGDDLGVALTLVDRWDEVDAEGKGIDEGARTNSGMSFYYSVSNLKTNFLRLIGNASLLDGDPEIDFEVGLGLGLLLRTQPLAGTGTGFGLAAGVGYNLMLDNPDQRWYTFVGLSVNFNQQGGAQ